jgi:replicative DNA helicase
MSIITAIELELCKKRELKAHIDKLEELTQDEFVTMEQVEILTKEIKVLKSQIYLSDQKKTFDDKLESVFDNFDLDLSKFDQMKLEFIKSGLIVKHEVTMLAAKPASGKSLVAIAMANMALEESKVNRIIYFDYDNGIVTLRDRGIQYLIQKHGRRRLRYIHESKLNKQELASLIKRLESTDLNDTFIIFDSIKHFHKGDRDKNKDSSVTMEMLKRLRRQGATILFLHHTNKPQKDTFELQYAGSSAWEEDTTNAFILKYNPHKKTFIFTPFKSRIGDLKPIAFQYNADFHLLEEVNLDFAQETAYDEEVRNEIITYLEGCEAPPNASQIKKHLASECGYTNNDKVHIVLQAGKGQFWQAKKIKEKNNMDIYELIQKTSIDKSDMSDNTDSTSKLKSKETPYA